MNLFEIEDARFEYEAQILDKIAAQQREEEQYQSYENFHRRQMIYNFYKNKKSVDEIDKIIAGVERKKPL